MFVDAWTRNDVVAAQDALRMGAHVNELNSAGSTGLMHAVWIGSSKMVQLLLAAGADVTIKNDTGSTDLDIAKLRQAASKIKNQIIELVQGEEIKQQQAIVAKEEAARKAKEEAERQEKIKINEKFITARRRNDIATVQDALRMGANVNEVNSVGWTGLMNAARDGNLEMVQALLAAGADVTIKSLGGLTALNIAKSGSATPEIKNQIIELLQQAEEKHKQEVAEKKQ
jgi:ankyrin repeat protein